ncbi:hypothetical protein ES332_A06G150900v1 [Gossypium tomentosum]|uniref:Uncharacterized protein n=1 Tax=Gossypium tomentosum TaxID=34277 RepID=A0A5D2Q482_GOSTO|nr:hypothetical protein ES332_A06G150900v1 [Gossypium tomentosum]
MGCCVSTNTGSLRAKESHLQVGVESKAPPPSAEEETVKEVLSETPKPKAPIFTPQQEESKQTQIEKPVFVKIQEKESLNFNVKTKPKSPVLEESASEEVSEICSVSLSESLSTVTDRRDEEDEVRQLKVFRSSARPGSRNRVVGRKLDQSPNKRNGVVNGGSSVRLVQSKGGSPDPGGSSGRRSRSPAVNRAVMGRSSSGGRTIHSPGRVRRDPGEQQQHVTTTTMEGKWPSSNNNGATTSAPNESLENPLVSLECFIFL